MNEVLPEGWKMKVVLIHTRDSFGNGNDAGVFFTDDVDKAWGAYQREHPGRYPNEVRGCFCFTVAEINEGDAIFASDFYGPTLEAKSQVIK